MFQKMELLPNESIVSMVEFAGTLYIATTQRIFKKLDNDELVPLQLITIEEMKDPVEHLPEASQ